MAQIIAIGVLVIAPAKINFHREREPRRHQPAQKTKRPATKILVNFRPSPNRLWNPLIIFPKTMPCLPAQCNSINSGMTSKNIRRHALHLTNNIQQFPRASQPQNIYFAAPLLKHFSAIHTKGRATPPPNCSCARRAQRLFRSPPPPRAPLPKNRFALCVSFAPLALNGCSGCSVFPDL